MQHWTIIKSATGEVLVVSFPTSGPAQHPKDAGYAWDPLVHSAIPIDHQPRPALEAFDGTTWKEVPALVEAMLIDKVKAANEALVKANYSQNYGKQKKYSRKQQEVLDFRALPAVLVGTTALMAPLTSFVPNFNAMTVEQRAKKFRFAMAEAKIRGVTIDQVIALFEVAIETVEQKVANWEAVEQKGISAIKAATTAAAKRAAYNAIDWNWS